MGVGERLVAATDRVSSVIGTCMIVLCLGWALWADHVRKMSCLYCGKYRGHESHCPYEALHRD